MGSGLRGIKRGEKCEEEGAKAKFKEEGVWDGVRERNGSKAREGALVEEIG